MHHRSIFLYPISLAYNLATSCRNLLYDVGILKATEYNIPIICVGNITVGGTGKTPHTEYIIALLKDKYNVAVLSRGYKRKTKGFLFANKRSSVSDIGDEPLQIFKKFKGITVAVDGNRRRGVETILRRRPETDVIIMDDGFQHRRVKPGLSIVLSDFERPIYHDFLLPYGNLRESIRGLKRSDIIIVTKTTKEASPDSLEETAKEIGKYQQTKMFFSSIDYKDLKPLFLKNAQGKMPLISKDNDKTGIVFISGIANPKPIYKHLQGYFKEIVHLSFPDHYQFSENDINRVIDAFDSLSSPRKFVITTEKDAVRLKEFMNNIKPIHPFIYYLPIMVSFLKGEQEEFNNLLLDYVRKNRPNRSISQL